MKVKLLASALVLSCVTALAQSAPVVHVAQGSVSGTQNDGVYAYKGIPYAAPPVGELRWKPPAAPASWTGVRNGSAFGASCPQTPIDQFLPWTKEFMTHGETSEDCLFLNVWTPSVTAKRKLPVIVFLHGGGFSGGSGSIDVYNGANLAKTGTVVVNLNYRLGALGFLSLPELTAESPHHSSGNYGVLDQIAALDWVRANIAAFGGDPRRVTIWGQSAGAASVAVLLTSPVAASSFDRAAADSGIGFTGLPMLSLSDAEKQGTAYEATLKTKSLKELRALPASAFLPPDPFHAPQFAPVLDGWVLRDNPSTLLRSGRGQNKPFITGYQAQDARPLFEKVTTVAEYHAFLSKTYLNSADAIFEAYPAKTDSDVMGAIDALNVDRQRVSIWLLAKDRAAAQAAPVYGYVFSRAIPWPAHPEFGAFHTGEIPYFFRNLNLLDRPFTPDDRRVSDAASAYLLNFASTGNPNGGALPKWPPAAQSGIAMEFDTAPQPVPLPDAAKTKLWQKYFTGPDAAHAPFL